MLRSGRRLLILALLIGFSGCGGSGAIDPGFPTDVSGPAPGPPTPKDAGDLDSISKNAAQSAKKSGAAKMP